MKVFYQVLYGDDRSALDVKDFNDRRAAVEFYNSVADRFFREFRKVQIVSYPGRGRQGA